jgi:predicted Holliday junction resolvase-like endonuclease
MEDKLISLFKKGSIDEYDVREFHKKVNDQILHIVESELEIRGYVFDNTDDLVSFMLNEMSFIKRAIIGRPFDFNIYGNLKNGKNIVALEIKTRITDSGIERKIKVIPANQKKLLGFNINMDHENENI